MLHDMLFHNWECPLRNMVFSNYLKLELLTSTAIDKIILPVDSPKLGVHVEGNSLLNWQIFLCQLLQNVDPIYLKMMYKVISLPRV